LTLIDQYQRNIDLTENRLSMEDSLLGGVSDAIQRLRELVVQSGDGGQNSDDKLFIASEVDQILNQLAGSLNSKDAGGEYIFAGFQGDKEPFVKNQAGNYQYNGDEGRRFIQVETNVTVAAGDNGKDIFVNVNSATNTFITTASPRNTGIPPAVITQGRVIDQQAYDAFYPEDMRIVFNPETNVVPPRTNYTITRVSDGRPILSNQVYAPGAAISAEGVVTEIVGDPRPGDTFFVNSSDTQGLLTTIERFSRALKDYKDNPEGRKVLTEAIDATLANITNAETKLLETRSSLGARLNTLANIREIQGDVGALTLGVLSDLQDLDYAEAINQLTLEDTILQAAQQSYTRVTNLSLFNFF
jgi:flagellar hook-associated protein 3 FlgL